MKIFGELWDYRQMISSLVKKDLTTRYKGSVLGFLWTFINPLFQLLIYSIVFTKILPIGADMEITARGPYAMYLFVALIPWLFCQSAIQAGSTCVISNAGLVQKVYFPRLVLPVSTVTSGFINMALSFIVVFAALLVTGVGLTPYAFFLPLIMLLEYFFVLGISIVVSAAAVYFRDLEHILSIVTMGWFYVTPILYTMNIVPEEFTGIMYANPMTGIILAYRDILFWGTMPDPAPLLSTVIVTVVAIVGGIPLFQRLQRRFAEEL